MMRCFCLILPYFVYERFCSAKKIIILFSQHSFMTLTFEKICNLKGLEHGMCVLLKVVQYDLTTSLEVSSFQF